MLTKYGKEKEKNFQALITFSYKIILSVTHNIGEKNYFFIHKPPWLHCEITLTM